MCAKIIGVLKVSNYESAFGAYINQLPNIHYSCSPGECISRRLADEVMWVARVGRVVEIGHGDVDAGAADAADDAVLNGLQRERKQVVRRMSE